MKFKLSIIACLLASPFVFSQEKYYEGKVITLKNDTINVTLSEKNNSSSIVFIDPITKKNKEYFAADIRGYILKNRKFVSKKIKKSTYQYIDNQLDPRGNVKYLTLDPSNFITEETAFCEILVEGPATLYRSLNFNFLPTYYISVDSEMLQEIPQDYYKVEYDQFTKELLKHKTIYQIDNPRYLVTKMNKYVDVLNNVFYTASKPFQVPVFDYSEKNLEKMVVEYNRRRGATNGGLLTSREKTKITFGVIGSYSPTIEIFESKKFNYGIPSMGIFAYKRIDNENANNFIKVGFSYFDFEHQSTDSYSFISKSFKTKSYNFSIAIDHVIGKKKIRPFVGGGFGVSKITNFNLNNTNNWVFPGTIEGGLIIKVKNHSIRAAYGISPLFKSQNFFRTTPISLAFIW